MKILRLDSLLYGRARKATSVVISRINSKTTGPNAVDTLCVDYYLHILHTFK